MYKLTLQTPKGTNEVTFPAYPTGLEVQQAARKLLYQPELCALVLPFKEPHADRPD